MWGGLFVFMVLFLLAGWNKQNKRARARPISDSFHDNIKIRRKMFSFSKPGVIQRHHFILINDCHWWACRKTDIYLHGCFVCHFSVSPWNNQNHCHLFYSSTFFPPFACVVGVCRAHVANLMMLCKFAVVFPLFACVLVWALLITMLQSLCFKLVQPILIPAHHIPTFWHAPFAPTWTRHPGFCPVMPKASPTKAHTPYI